MSNIETIDYQGKNYATVPARIKEFRSVNPRSSIETEPRFLDDGSCIFRATIITDLSDEASSRATGTARYNAKEISERKAFEKLETIATGRALSLLGYLNNGEVASTEEMLEYEGYQEDKMEQAIQAIKVAKDTKELMEIQSGVSATMQIQLNAPIRERLEELKHAAAK